MRGELVEEVARLVLGHAHDPERAAGDGIERLAAVTGCGRAIRCVISGIFAFCASDSGDAAVRLASSTSWRLP
jgi:hypothetical protein